MLQGIGFLLFGTGIVLQSWTHAGKYKNKKETKELIKFIGMLLLGVASLILGIKAFIPFFD